MQLGTVPAKVARYGLLASCLHGANGAEYGQTYANIIFWDKIMRPGPILALNTASNPHSP